MKSFVFQSVVGLLFICAFSQTGLGQMITGHRGASHDAPENTLAAFQLAWEQGADAVEGDFYLTADSHIVCIHDADTLRTAGIKKIVAKTTLDELRQLDAGAWKNPRFKGERIPTFAEVMQCIPAGKTFVIELKTDPAVVPVLEKELKRLQPDPSSLLIIAFNAETIAACKKTFPEIKAHWLTSFKRSNGIGPWTPAAQQIIDTVKKTGADGVGLKGERAVIDQSFIEKLASGGVNDFHVWTIDSPADAQYFIELGASGITTNRPAYIRQTLEGGN